MRVATAWSRLCAELRTKPLLFSTLKNKGRSDCSQMPEWCLRFGIVPLVNEPSLNPEQAARYAEQLCEIGLSHGIDRMGVAPANIMLRARTILHER